MHISMQPVCKSMQIVCKKCGYTWEYAGNKLRTSCSKCKTSVTIPKSRLDESDEETKPKKQTPPPKPVVAASEGAVRVVITSDHFAALIKHMTKMHTENADEPRYAIEYNTLTRELFVDVAEKEELEAIPER